MYHMSVRILVDKSREIRQEMHVVSHLFTTLPIRVKTVSYTSVSRKHDIAMHRCS